MKQTFTNTHDFQFGSLEILFDVSFVGTLVFDGNLPRESVINTQKLRKRWRSLKSYIAHPSGAGASLAPNNAFRFAPQRSPSSYRRGFRSPNYPGKKITRFCFSSRHTVHRAFARRMERPGYASVFFPLSRMCKNTPLRGMFKGAL